MSASPFARPTGLLVGSLLLALMAMIALAAHWLAPVDPFALSDRALLPPTHVHPFGTDDLGRDVWAGVVHGSRNSLQIGLIAATISALVGLLVGGIAGIGSARIDQVLMRGTEFVQALPRFFLVVLIVNFFGSGANTVAVVIGLTAWPAVARLFRAQVVSTVGRDFVAAARAAGARDLTVVTRHVLPVSAAVVAAQISYQAGSAILADAGISFLGLGDPTTMSWGALLGSAQHFVRDAWWMSVFPGLALTLTVLGCNLIADATGRPIARYAPPTNESASERIAPTADDSRWKSIGGRPALSASASAPS